MLHNDAVAQGCRAAYSPAQLQVWFEGRSPRMYQAAIEAGRVWLAEADGELLGFVGFAAGEVTLLFVKPAACGCGVGTMLFEWGLAQAGINFVGPMTVVATLNSQRFYEGHGFLPVEHCDVMRGQPPLAIAVVRMQRCVGVPQPHAQSVEV